MNQSIPYRPYSEELEQLTSGYVMANRINDIVAKPNTQRYRDYLKLIQDQFINEPAFDPDDQYREQAKELLPRALDAFEFRHGTKVTAGRLFRYQEFCIAAAPDAIEGEMVGMTVHIRQSNETFEAAIERGVDKEMQRHAQAMLLVTGMKYWLHLEYWEDAAIRRRRLFDHCVSFNPRHAAALEEAMIGFVAKSRMRAVA